MASGRVGGDWTVCRRRSRTGFCISSWGLSLRASRFCTCVSTASRGTENPAPSTTPGVLVHLFQTHIAANAGYSLARIPSRRGQVWANTYAPASWAQGQAARGRDAEAAAAQGEGDAGDAHALARQKEEGVLMHKNRVVFARYRDVRRQTA
jgi:hypothetical protein